MTYEQIKTEYLQGETTVKELRKQNNLTPYDWRRIQKKITAETNYKREGRTPTPKRKPHTGTITKSKYEKTYRLSRITKGKRTEYGRYINKHEAEIVRQKLIETDWDKTQLPRIQKEAKEQLQKQQTPIRQVIPPARPIRQPHYLTNLEKTIKDLGGEEYIKQQRWNKKTKQELAKELGTSEQTLHKYLQKHNISWRKLPRRRTRPSRLEGVTIEKICKLKKEGYSARAIATKYHLKSPQSIYRYCQTQGTTWSQI